MKKEGCDKRLYGGIDLSNMLSSMHESLISSIVENAQAWRIRSSSSTKRRLRKAVDELEEYKRQVGK